MMFHWIKYCVRDTTTRIQSLLIWLFHYLIRIKIFFFCCVYLIGNIFLFEKYDYRAYLHHVNKSEKPVKRKRQKKRTKTSLFILKPVSKKKTIVFYIKYPATKKFHGIFQHKKPSQKRYQFSRIYFLLVIFHCGDDWSITCLSKNM